MEVLNVEGCVLKLAGLLNHSNEGALVYDGKRAQRTNSSVLRLGIDSRRKPSEVPKQPKYQQKYPPERRLAMALKRIERGIWKTLNSPRTAAENFPRYPRMRSAACSDRCCAIKTWCPRGLRAFICLAKHGFVERGGNEKGNGGDREDLIRQSTDPPIFNGLF